MRILLTGADGQLGRDLQAVLAGHDLNPTDIEEMDITDFYAVARQVQRFQPELIMHVAAYTDVDKAELNPDLAFKVNAIGTQNLAIAANKHQAALLYVSTDYVFDGLKGEPYIEFDRTNPTSVYGQSKLAGELYVQTLTNQFYICRTAWLYGRYGHNFVKTMLRLAEEKRVLKVVNDQVGSPTYAHDLAHKLAEIGLSGQFGVYHVVNEGAVSWYEFAQKIFALAGLQVKVEPAKTAEISRPAPRPPYSVLNTMSLRLRGFSPLRRWDEALEEFMVTI